ncbi:MAG: hypothetical protein ACYTEZ_07770 [Planctomycetota bacterium]
MGRFALTVLGLAIVAVAAILIAKGVLRPTQEKVQRSKSVLTGAYEAKFLECFVLEDRDLPDELAPPKVDEDLVYLRVDLLYPGVERVPSPKSHVLQTINGVPGTELRPVHTAYEVGYEGTYLYLVYRSDQSFAFAHMSREGTLLFEKVALE